MSRHDQSLPLLDDTAEHWQAVASEQPGADPRMAWPLLRVWARHLHPSEPVRVLTAGPSAEQMLLLPVRSAVRRRCGMPFRVLAGPRDEFWECSDPPLSGKPAVAAEALIARLGELAAWELLEVGPLREDRPLVEALRCAAGKRRLHCELLPYAEDPIVRIDGRWDDYYASRSGNLRSSTGRSERKLGRAGALEFRSDPTTEGLADLFRVEASGWKGDAGTAIVSDFATRAFYEELAEAAATQGWLRLYRLLVDGRCIAADLALLYGRTVYMLKMGYDVEWAEYAPGRVLRKCTIEHLFASGEADIYDQLVAIGDRNRHKYEWANDLRRYLVVRLYNPRSVGARFALGAKTGGRTLRAIARRAGEAAHRRPAA